ncbi:phage head closure protein [Kerstersia gyiorum]|uniref:phage head closure protein n=1 Tax=Kerstersia gyiorum TaxID=206506 RepID=UPI00214FE7AF|nr:phage head closure protein [Kerstersia gyiorum]MCR4158819.1 phage head closure protein [Kerstersia gyiorum]
MQAGSLNRRIVIQRRTQGQDDAGQPIDTWEDFAKPWSWIKTQSGVSASKSLTEAQDGVARSIVAYSFRIRYRPSVTDDMRVVYGGMIFAIKQVRHDLAEHIWTDLVCEEGGADG